ncbi:MAG: sensor histidine kinase [Gammaproteobacteria bacterium]
MRIFFFFLLCWLIGPQAWAGDLIVERAMLEDPSGTMTISDVTAADFRPIGAIMSQGYSDSAFWLRIRVDSPPTPEPVELRIRPTFLDDIRLYEPNGDGTWKIHVSGDRYGYQERERAAVTLGFIVRPKASENTYYLRLKTTSTALLNVEALVPREAQLKDLKLILLHTAYLAVVVWILFFAVNDYMTHRQRLSLWFILFEASNLLAIAALNGYLALWVPAAHPEWADTLTSMIMASVLFYVTPFFFALFRLYDVPRSLMAVLASAILVSMISFAMFAMGYVRPMLEASALAMLVYALFISLLPWRAKREGLPSRRVLRVVFGLQTASILCTALPLLGWVDAVEWSLNNTLTHALLSGLLMFYVMNQRQRQLLDKGRQAMLQLELAEQHLQLEQAKLEEQGRFMAMLTHELKTPISVMRMVLGLEQASESAKRHAHKALQDINAVVERCRQSDRLEQSQWMPRFQACNLHRLWEEVCQASESPKRFVIEAETVADIHSDPQLLGVIFGNLADNALKYSVANSTIYVRLEAKEIAGISRVCFSIENQAGNAGLPDPKRVFDKYYRSPQAHGQTGSGLGLYLVRGFAELLGGNIECRTLADKARFTLLMPNIAP